MTSGTHVIIIIICPTAIAYSMGQIIKSVCVCQSVYLSVCDHSHGRISQSIFTKIGTDVKTPKRKNEFVGVNIAPPLPIFYPPKPPILGQEVLKPHANIE